MNTVVDFINNWLIFVIIGVVFIWLIVQGIRYDKKHFDLMVNDEVYRLCYSYTDDMMNKGLIRMNKVQKLGGSIVVIEDSEIKQVIRKTSVFNISKSQREYEIKLEDGTREMIICKGLSEAAADEEMNKLYQSLKTI